MRKLDVIHSFLLRGPELVVNAVIEKAGIDSKELVNTIDAQGSYPLHRVSSRGCERSVQTLFKTRAD